MKELQFKVKDKCSAAGTMRPLSVHKNRARFNNYWNRRWKLHLDDAQTWLDLVFCCCLLSELLHEYIINLHLFHFVPLLLTLFQNTVFTINVYLLLIRFRLPLLNIVTIDTLDFVLSFRYFTMPNTKCTLKSLISSYTTVPC